MIDTYLFFFFFSFLFIFFNFILFFKLYIIVLVLPNIKMNPPQVYMCSPSWTLLRPPSAFHPSGSSQCTSPKHPVSCIEEGWNESQSGWAELCCFCRFQRSRCHLPFLASPASLIPRLLIPRTSASANTFPDSNPLTFHVRTLVIRLGSLDNPD